MAYSLFTFETAISVSCLTAGSFALLLVLSQSIPPCLLLPPRLLPNAGVRFISQRSLSTLSVCGGGNCFTFAHQKKATSAIGKINKN